MGPGFSLTWNKNRCGSLKCKVLCYVLGTIIYWNRVWSSTSMQIWTVNYCQSRWGSFRDSIIQSECCFWWTRVTLPKTMDSCEHDHSSGWWDFLLMDSSLMGEEPIFRRIGPDRTKRLVIRHVTAVAIGRRVDLEGGWDNSWRILKPTSFWSLRNHHNFFAGLGSQWHRTKKGPYDIGKNSFFFLTILSIKHFYGFIQKGRVIHIDSWNPLEKIAPWQHGFPSQTGLWMKTTQILTTHSASRWMCQTVFFGSQMAMQNTKITVDALCYFLVASEHEQPAKPRGWDFKLHSFFNEAQRWIFWGEELRKVKVGNVNSLAQLVMGHSILIL